MTEYIDWSKAIVNPSFPNLKPTAKLISIRMPEMTISQLKMIANKMDVPYQSLIKTYVAEGLKREHCKPKK
jgi:predicted DNA binding CopG/RHH family protein